MQKKYSLSIALLGIFTAISPLKLRAETTPTCYRILKSETAEASATPHGDEFEVWCYQNVSEGLFIFNADGDRVSAETALLIDEKNEIIHGSMVADEVSLHRVSAHQFNPFSIPLVEPRGESPARPEEIRAAFDTAPAVLDQFRVGQRIPAADLVLNPGRAIASVPRDRLPWRGYWWPYKGMPLARNSGSPLGKYDRFVTSYSGSNPGSADWERSRHAYRGINWEGHCNGWAASAILRKEPKIRKRDPRTGIVFTVADQKGILSERDYCASTAFFGRRYNAKPGQDISDIYPDLFHKTITYYIGQLGKPVALDYKRGFEVDNHIASGYRMNVEKLNSNTYRITTVLTVHKYDSSSRASPGVAPTYKRTYRYQLKVDGNGQIASGRWLSGNPDFLWVPLASPKCRTQNPQIEEDWTVRILGLPPA